MRKSTPILISVSVLLVASLACALPNVVVVATQDINSLGTAVMQTMIVGASQTAAAGVPVGLQDTATASLTFTPITPSLTPTITLTPTPIFTPTPLVPMISVSVATNCRVGPGKVYDRVGALLVGQTAEVVGRNPIGNYWYIRNPSQNGGYCWLWGEYATLTGNLSVLPVFTPPPTPTPVPSFDPSYDGLESCTGWWVDIEMVNTGGISFESLSLTVEDTDTGTVVAMSSDHFINLNGCFDSVSREDLDPGDNRTVSSPAFTYNLVGHRLRATVTLCSGAGLNGMCVTETIRFTP